jgi:hypothetical protein
MLSSWCDRPYYYSYYYYYCSHDSVVHIVTKIRVGRCRDRIPAGRDFIFSKPSRPATEPTQLPVPRVPVVFPWGEAAGAWSWSLTFIQWSFPVTSYEESEMGMERRASILTLASGTTRTAEVSALRAGSTSPPRKFLGTHFCYSVSGTQCYWMRTEGTGHLKISKELTGNRNRNPFI